MNGGKLEKSYIENIYNDKIISGIRIDEYLMNGKIIALIVMSSSSSTLCSSKKQQKILKFRLGK